MADSSSACYSARPTAARPASARRSVAGWVVCFAPAVWTVSLHAPDDVLRNKIVPTNDQIGLPAIMEAADDFYAKTGRQVTYEYVLLGGLNDGKAEAHTLADLLRGRQAHVNLIPFNAVEG